MDRVESRDEIARPLIEDVRESKPAGYAEREIEIRPAVSPAQSEGTDLGSHHDAGVVLSELHYMVAQAIPLLDGEHGPIMPPDGSQPAKSAPVSRVLNYAVGLGEAPETAIQKALALEEMDYALSTQGIVPVHLWVCV